MDRLVLLTRLEAASSVVGGDWGVGSETLRVLVLTVVVDALLGSADAVH